MAEVLVQFSDPLIADNRVYVARACGGEMPDGLWQGWIEFLPADGGDALRTGRETTQPNRADTLYWGDRAHGRVPRRRAGASVAAHPSSSH